ncbi:MAG: hypothetical protein ABIR06_15375 [Cyclobacteriaceae bacterium]
MMENTSYSTHRKIFIFLIAFCILLTTFGLSQKPTDRKLVGMFDGRTPCQELARFLETPVTSECIKIKWRLFLYVHPDSQQSGTYELLGFVYEKKNPRLGKWHTIKGTKTNPDALVYQLDYEGKKPILLQKGGDNILFFLDDEKNIMVGNRDFSFALNRVPRK